jgi:hypothetical protein
MDKVLKPSGVIHHRQNPLDSKLCTAVPLTLRHARIRETTIIHGIYSEYIKYAVADGEQKGALPARGLREEV